MNVGSIVPVTCVQFGATRVMELALCGDGGTNELPAPSPLATAHQPNPRPHPTSNASAGAPLTSMNRIGVAALAGCCSALIGAPTELVIIHQQARP